jgi:actin-related protein 2
VREIKEKCCFVSQNLQKERKLALETTLIDMDYTLPDKTVIRLGAERFEAAEILFDSSAGNNNGKTTIAEVIVDTLCDRNLMNDFTNEAGTGLVQNIMITGGTTMYAGMGQRLKTEIENGLVAKKYKGSRAPLKSIGMEIVDPPRRKNAVFIGAALFGRALAQQGEGGFVTKREWEEKGRTCVHRD